jgi:16S rRNA (cytosine1402-N4)-methyltransferase
MTTPTPADSAHDPVLLDEALAFLAPAAGRTYCDATVGLGGHAEAILRRSSPDSRLIGIERDAEALGRAADRLAQFGDRVRLVHARFSSLHTVLEQAAALPVDGCLVDLGVSSLQLDRAERGFSFRRSGPLDMRMDPSQGESAAELLDRADATLLEGLLRDLGEERFARRIAAAIIAARDRGALSTTSDLAEVVGRAVPARERHRDPATRTFQALRIAVNDELGELEQLLLQVPGFLRPGGRVVIISFHSLEDRMVKQRFRHLASSRPGGAPSLRLLTKHVIVAGDEERERNPRSRSAKLRAAERLPA